MLQSYSQQRPSAMGQPPSQTRSPVREWQPTGSGSLARRLRGSELLVNYSERFNDGNFELTLSASLQTSLTGTQLRNRCRAAWWQTRKRRPVVGIQVGLGQAVFEPIVEACDAERWATRTCTVAADASVEAVALDRARRPLSATSMTLVLTDPSRGRAGCVLNMSHVLINHEGYAIIADFLALLAHPPCERGIAASFEAEAVAATLPKLPQSLSQAYGQLVPAPTAEELQHAMAVFEGAQQRWARPSVGIPLHPDAASRRSRVHNRLVTFEPSLSRAALQASRRMGVSITAAFFACITLAMARRYGTGREQGAHLLFSANAERWLDARRRSGLQPVTMTIVPGGLWLDATALRVGPAADEPAGALARLASAIDSAQREDLASPHIIAVYDQLAPAMADAVADSYRLALPTLPPVGRPTLTSQGRFDGCLPAVGAAARDEVRMTDFRTGGRNTDPNVCFALYSFRDKLRCNLLFDERFFDPDEVAQLASAVTDLFRIMSLSCTKHDVVSARV
ncbi:uncharacterized protein MAM_08410 [Metarhizium album ARSEF 1941]|uniref:Condensation domain-containing protein n=1 Tax=Metarhizium album (strain ARSEF 1941) TaxID=1081103 RepID=A0A0B2WJA6_METAS|nr:uncharacterized protein MAM_08410 [Metarhizium album ARSEF 1941]KHN93739.1 hypothetical protein MAM_08410 [Metarhizium album ARSEF 1941]